MFVNCFKHFDTCYFNRVEDLVGKIPRQVEQECVMQVQVHIKSSRVLARKQAALSQVASVMAKSSFQDKRSSTVQANLQASK